MATAQSAVTVSKSGTDASTATGDGGGPGALGPGRTRVACWDPPVPGRGLGRPPDSQQCDRHAVGQSAKCSVTAAGGGNEQDKEERGPGLRAAAGGSNDRAPATPVVADGQWPPRTSSDRPSGPAACCPRETHAHGETQSADRRMAERDGPGRQAARATLMSGAAT